MRKIEELKSYLLKNHVNEYGDLFLGGLDFSDFDGDVFIGEMIVKRSLDQSGQTVGGCLHQSEQTVGDDLYQSGQIVGGYLYQSRQNVVGDLSQSNHEVNGNYYSTNINVTGTITFEEPKKALKEITAEELAKLGYKLKGEN